MNLSENVKEVKDEKVFKSYAVQTVTIEIIDLVEEFSEENLGIFFLTFYV